MAMLFYRQTLTVTARAIGKYVDAMNEEENLRKEKPCNPVVVCRV